MEIKGLLYSTKISKRIVKTLKIASYFRRKRETGKKKIVRELFGGLKIVYYFYLSFDRKSKVC